MSDVALTRIYVLRDPRDNEIRYVGKTVQLLRQRLAEHLKTAASGARTHNYTWIRSLATLGLKPTIELVAEARDDWAEVESAWISRLRAAGERLTNLTAGGDGVPGHRHSEATIERLRILNKPGAPRWTAEERAAISARLKGVPKSEDHRRKTKESCVGRPPHPWSPSHRANYEAALAARRARLSANP